MQAPRRELVPETKLPKRRHAQLRDARGLLRLPRDPAEVDDVLEALALIDWTNAIGPRVASYIGNQPKSHYGRHSPR